MKALVSTRKRIALACAFALLLIVGTLVASGAWNRLCGNYPIRFYGHIVDEQGRGMADVTINVRIGYSPTLVIPLPMGRSEKIRTFDVVTDANGDFEFDGGTGYWLSLRGFMSPAGTLVRTGSPPFPPADWSLDEVMQRNSLPSRPEKRLIYRMSRSRLK